MRHRTIDGRRMAPVAANLSVRVGIDQRCPFGRELGCGGQRDQVRVGHAKIFIAKRSSPGMKMNSWSCEFHGKSGPIGTSSHSKSSLSSPSS